MQTMVASIGMIRKLTDDGALWLVHKPQNKSYYTLVVGERLEGESGRTSLEREINWALKLESNRDYIISSVARLNYDTEFAKQGEQEVTLFSIEFYIVELYGKLWPTTLETNIACRWVTTEELLEGTLADGAIFDSTVRTLLNRAGVLVGC
jgi:hypothetical protein